MKTETVTAACTISASPYGAREKGEKFSVPSDAAAQLEKQGFVTRAASKSSTPPKP